MKIFLAAFITLTICGAGRAVSEPLSLQSLTPAPRSWEKMEFSLTGAPQGANPYDPDVVAVDATFTGPSGRPIAIPAFWYQPYTHQLVKGGAGTGGGSERETLTPEGAAGWRVRFTPVEKGRHHYRLVVQENSKETLTSSGSFDVGAKQPEDHGFARVEPTGKRSFVLDDGTPLPLLGENACWPGARGTYDYTDWFAGFKQNAMNYTRLWMWPQSFGIEVRPGDRLNYNQQTAWQLDTVLDMALQDHIYVMLCLDYHGMFGVKPDMWGGNNFWPQNPYNVTQGGPCAVQNDFFTNEAAKKLYRKRLRYLIARYSSTPGLLSWEFFNEINNDYEFLKPADVAAWHDEMAQWMHQNDPYRHLVTTSFGSAGEQPEMWKLPSIDYAQWHWYGTWGGPYTHPATMAAGVARHFQEEYHKPVYISEFGTSGKSWDPAGDPNRRGLQQALWSGLLSGTAGTAMPWWWEDIHRENLYFLWGALSKFLAGTGFDSGAWRPAEVSGPAPLATLGDPAPGALPFTVNIPLTGNWGDKPSGRLILHNAADAVGAPLHPYVHGSSKLQFKVPFIINANFGEGAQLVVHLNSVASDAILAVKVSGKEIFRRALPNKDGKYELNEEYNEDITVSLPPGKEEVEIDNPGGDWFYLDSIRLVNVLPDDMTEPILLDTFGMTDGRSTLVWALDHRYNWPDGKDLPPQPVNNAALTLRNLPDGHYRAEWWDTRAGKVLGVTHGVSHDGKMELPMPPFSVDVAARVTPNP